MTETNKLQKIVDRLRGCVENDQAQGLDMDAVNWNMQEGILISGNDAKAIVDALSPLPQKSNADIHDNFDPLIVKAARVFVETQNPSVSLLQQRFALTYARADKIMNELYSLDFVGAFNGTKPRKLYAEGLAQLEKMFPKYAKREGDGNG